MPFEHGKAVESAPAPAKTTAELTHTEPHTDDDTQAIKQELAIAPYKEYFGDLDTDGREKLEYILGKLNPEDALESDEVVAKIRRIDAQFGRGDGEQRLDKVYRYLRLFDTINEHVLGGL